MEISSTAQQPCRREASRKRARTLPASMECGLAPSPEKAFTCGDATPTQSHSSGPNSAFPANASEALLSSRAWHSSL